MKLPEKTAILILSAFLLTGSILLYIRDSRPFSDITIEKNAFEPELSLEEVKQMLEEKRKVDLNTASHDELVSIPGVGDATALKIIAFRDGGGVFYSARDLLLIKGIGEKKLDRIREYIKTE